MNMKRHGSTEIWFIGLHLIDVRALFFTTYIAFRYIRQPLIDDYAFRQPKLVNIILDAKREAWCLPTKPLLRFSMVNSV